MAAAGGQAGREAGRPRGGAPRRSPCAEPRAAAAPGGAFPGPGRAGPRPRPPSSPDLPSSPHRLASPAGHLPAAGAASRPPRWRRARCWRAAPPAPARCKAGAARAAASGGERGGQGRARKKEGSRGSRIRGRASPSRSAGAAARCLGATAGGTELRLVKFPCPREPRCAQTGLCERGGCAKRRLAFPPPRGHVTRSLPRRSSGRSARAERAAPAPGPSPRVGIFLPLRAPPHPPGPGFSHGAGGAEGACWQSLSARPKLCVSWEGESPLFLAKATQLLKSRCLGTVLTSPLKAKVCSSKH